MSHAQQTALTKARLVQDVECSSRFMECSSRGQHTPENLPFISQLFTNILHLYLWNAAQRNPDSLSLVVLKVLKGKKLFVLKYFKAQLWVLHQLLIPHVKSPVLPPHRKVLILQWKWHKPSLAQNSDGSPQSQRGEMRAADAQKFNQNSAWNLLLDVEIFVLHSKFGQRGSSARDIHKPLTPHWNSDWTEVLFPTLKCLTLNLNKLLIHDTSNMQLNQGGTSHRAALPNKTVRAGVTHLH